MAFQDYFSKQSGIYAKARPTYPAELFDFLSGLAKQHNTCWDCGTGNGQAAVALSKKFKQIIATDPSANQISNAVPAANIEYRVAPAEDSGIGSNTIDLITVATAAHWFDLEKFYAEAKRVAKPEGILAVWTYSEASIGAELDVLMGWFAYDLLYNYWPDGRWYVRNKYTTLPFPFTQIETPKFYCRLNLSKQQWLDYVRSWSAYNNYLAKHNTDPIEQLMPKLNLLWNDIEVKPVTWPLHLKCTKLNA